MGDDETLIEVLSKLQMSDDTSQVRGLEFKSVEI